jgi:hypothetical protein
MAKELEAKFIFVLGSANKAKRLPHMSSLRISRGTEPHQEETPPTDAACPASPHPVDILDILQALSYKIESIRTKIRQIEQLETATTTTKPTKLVTTIVQ